MFRNLFPKRKNTKMDIKAGNEFFIDSKNNSPFDNYAAYATILDVKEGWVQYKMGRKNRKSTLKPSEKRISSFLKIYSKVN